MREIKFRAWDKEDRVMDYSMSFAGNISENMNDKPGIGEGERFSELMQFTGMKDKNGKEIYEGDIIKLIDDVGDEILVTCEFGTVQREIFGQTLNLCDITGFYFRKDGKATFPIVNNYAGKNDLELFEVIGNIYENPELVSSSEIPTEK